MFGKKRPQPQTDSVNASMDETHALEQNAKYREALAHLHQGDWVTSIHLLDALCEQHPHNSRIRQLLDEARFKAELDAKARVGGKRFIIPWRRMGLATAFIVTLTVLILAGFFVLNGRIRPILAQAAQKRAQMQLLNSAQAYLTAGEWDLAEQYFTALLDELPNHSDAEEGLALIAEERSLRRLYDAAVEAEESGDTDSALQGYMELQTRRAGYMDTSERIARLRRWQDIDVLFQDSQTLVQMGLASMAVERLEQARSLDVSYRRREIAPLLSGLYLREAQQIIDAVPAQLGEIPAALDLLDKALALDTRNQAALTERRLARLFVEGREFARRYEWRQAAGRFQAILDERAGYLAGAIPSLLYDAYMGSGDQYRNSNDCALAYGEYRKAAQLQISDTTVATARMAEVAACLTPTPTASNTPLPTAPPAPTGTPTPEPTPIPLLQFRGKIAFKSDHPEQPGMWVVNPDGSGRQYLGTLNAYATQINALREAETWSPDRTMRVYVTDQDGRAQIFIDYSQHPQFRSIGNKALTRMSGIAYDPVWSPDGGMIAYVTQENESDDIWLMHADGNRQRALMRNDWEWDKHPSWSPDSTLIVFWSNRNGLKQIYVMDTNGKVLRNLSSVGWDEYDPIWIK